VIVLTEVYMEEQAAILETEHIVEEMTEAMEPAMSETEATEEAVAVT
jgi:hypothetical protein